MAAGSVVIGANAGGIPDVVTHEINGFLFDPDQRGALVHAAQRIVSEPAMCHAIRANARQQAEEWSWAAATKQLVHFYETAMAMPRFEKSARSNAPWMLAMKRAAIGGMKLFLS